MDLRNECSKNYVQEETQFLVGANTIEYRMKIFLFQFLWSNLIKSNSEIANSCFLQLKNSWLAHWAHVTARGAEVCANKITKEASPICSAM